MCLVSTCSIFDELVEPSKDSHKKEGCQTPADEQSRGYTPASSSVGQRQELGLHPPPPTSLGAAHGTWNM